jgi:Spy/CpxP family protein refolding chaperone
MRNRVLLIAIMTIWVASSAKAELKLRPVHPDESVKYTYENRFSLESSLESLQQIQGYLKSFQVLTEETKAKVSRQKMKEIGNTDWETQNMGFRNFPRGIEGTLRKQDYQIRELRYQLAKEKFKQKVIGEKELAEAKQAFEEAEKSFQTFWDKFGISD